MNNTLLMTGWGLPVYAPAAAMALRCVFRSDFADVVGVSRRNLAKGLEDLGSRYEEVYILGVGLDVEPRRIAEAVSKLGAANVRVTWISDRELPKEVAPVFRVHGAEKCFTEMLIDDGGDLLKAIQSAFPTRITDEDVTFFRRYVAEKPKTGSEQDEYRQLFEAADWMHKTYRELDHYAVAIGLLANKVSPSAFRKEQRDIIDLYVKWGRRELLGVSEHTKEVSRKITLAAEYADPEARVLITGPSGTGKETVAQQIHMRSVRKTGPFMSFNCACATKELFESKLFGHVKGAFTGAVNDTEGLFAAAEGGTLFLDEIGELDIELQGYLLRVLQDGEYQKVGSPAPQKVRDVRLITATNRDLVRSVEEGRFREDLYHRLNVIQIRMRGLKDRPEDIPVIADGLWFRETHRHLSAEQKLALKDYSYPGNARELENMLVRARALKITDFGELMAQHKADNAGLFRKLSATEEEGGDETLEGAKRRHAKRIFEKYHSLGYSKRKIAKEILDISENTLKELLS